MRKLIETGLVKRTILLNEKFEMRILDKSNIDEMMELQNEVVEHLSDIQTFVNDPKDFILNEILDDDKGRAIGVFAGHKLAAFRTISFPGNSELNMGREINIPEDELNHVVHLESTVVHPEYRGNKLQAKMMKHTFDIINELGYFYVCTTISPFNYPSLKNVIEAGLTIKALGQRGGTYEGRWRFLLSRDIRHTELQQFENYIQVENGKLNKQQEILSKGFVGFMLTRGNYISDGFIINYGIPTAPIE